MQVVHSVNIPRCPPRKQELEARTVSFPPKLLCDATFHHRSFPCRAPLWTKNDRQVTWSSPHIIITIPIHRYQSQKEEMMKEYADTAAKAKTHSFQVEDTVLVRQKRVNELFSPNNKHQYTIVKIKDSMITARNATSYISCNHLQLAVQENHHACTRAILRKLGVIPQETSRTFNKHWLSAPTIFKLTMFYNSFVCGNTT